MLICARFGECQGVTTEIKCVRPALDCLEGRREVPRPPDFDLAVSRPSVRTAASASRISIMALEEVPLAMMANRRRPGTTSRKSSRRLPATSVCWSDEPVMLPPGRDRLATRPAPTGSAATAKTIGTTEVACFVTKVGAVPSYNDIDLKLDELGRNLGDALVASLRPAILDRYVTAFDQPCSRSLCVNAVTQWLATKVWPSLGARW